MTILVTGGTGFLGSYFTRYALQSGGQERIVVLDKHLDLGRIEDVLDRTTVIEGDVADPETMRRAIADHGVDRIAHYAFILGSPALGQMLPYVRVQTDGVANVFEAARSAGVRRVLFCSSVAAYGRQTASRLTEDLATDTLEPYGFSKVWAEALGRYYTQELGLEVVSLRFGSTYGLGRAWRGSYNSGLLEPPRQSHYMARVEDAVRGRPIDMPRGDALADFTYADDAAQAAWLALTAPHLPHHLYNVAADRRPVGEFSDALQELLPDARITVSETDAPTNPHPPMDNRRLRDLGFTPRHTLTSGLRDYIERIRAYDQYAERRRAPT
ncbi:NAD(P)-dependent oxidoreductase [Phenylobacterium sp. LjRoot225]|uniref:NAD-dependent epimerase/dehydratase family protein n=1 Tax=Phenylobacterium sp. LjRoot225 TaxID=3342285 RepID=UPI003ED0CEBF